MPSKFITDLDCQPSCGSPCSKGTVSSFCCMIKKAVRDLNPCGLSTRRGISKYVDMRYGMKDNCLLNCSLKWLVCSGILRRKCGLYSFCCSSEVITNKSACGLDCKSDCCKPCYKPCCKSKKCKVKCPKLCKPKCCKPCCKPKCCKLNCCKPKCCKWKCCKPKCCKPCCKPKCCKPKCCKPCCKPKCCVPKCKPKKKCRSQCYCTKCVST